MIFPTPPYTIRPSGNNNLALPRKTVSRRAEGVRKFRHGALFQTNFRRNYGFDKKRGFVVSIGLAAHEKLETSTTFLEVFELPKRSSKEVGL